jgi:hypothetical protein
VETGSALSSAILIEPLKNLHDNEVSLRANAVVQAYFNMLFHIVKKLEVVQLTKNCVLLDALPTSG